MSGHLISTIIWKWFEIGCKLVLFANMKVAYGLSIELLVSNFMTLMTLNGAVIDDSRALCASRTLV